MSIPEAIPLVTSCIESLDHSTMDPWADPERTQDREGGPDCKEASVVGSVQGVDGVWYIAAALATDRADVDAGPLVLVLDVPIGVLGSREVRGVKV